MDRRSFLRHQRHARAAAAHRNSAVAAVTKAESGDAKLNALFEQIFQERVRNPELASSLGLDKGPNAALKSKFDTRPAQLRAKEDLARNRRAIAGLNAIGPAPCPSREAQSRGRPLFARDRDPGANALGNRSARSGPIRSRSRAAPISRPPISSTPRTRSTMRLTPKLICRGSANSRSARQRHRRPARTGRPRLPRPAWSIDLALGQMRKLRDVAARAEFDGAVAGRNVPAAKGIAGDWQAPCFLDRCQERLPALDRQMATMQQLKPTTRPGDGAWRLPKAKRSTRRRFPRRPPPTSLRPRFTRWASTQVADISEPARSDPARARLYARQRRRAAHRLA